MINVFNELKRRNVFRVAAVYAVVAWLLMQLSSQLEESLNLPEWFDTVVTVTVLLGFPIALLLAWAFEMTPQGVKRTEPLRQQNASKASKRKSAMIFITSIIIVSIALGAWWLVPTSPTTVEPAAQQTDALVVKELPSIAVLPFDDFSKDNDQQYFANGISEELLNVLARIDGLRVASRTSAFSFQNSGADTGTIAKALGVGHILEGSIRKSGSTLRITAQLIDALNDQHLWSETYDRPLTAENIFEIQDEIAGSIVAELKGRLSIDTSNSALRTESLEAYQLYLRARENMAKRLPDMLNAAIQEFKQVVELDPNFAPAHAGLADTYLLMPGYANVDKEESVLKARGHVEQALTLAPNSVEALTAASLLATEDGEYQKAVTLATQAININPNYMPAYHRRGTAYGALGKNIKALAEFEKAEELDPLSPIILSNLGAFQVLLGDNKAAEATYDKNIRYNPGSDFGYSGLAGLKFFYGDYDLAHSLLKDAQAINPENVAVIDTLGFLYSTVGLFDEALKLELPPSSRAYTLLASGQFDAAREVAVDMPNSPNMHRVYLGDSERSYGLLRKWADLSNFIEQPIKDTTAPLVVIMSVVFQRQSDPDAKRLIDKVSAYFSGKSPEDFLHGSALEAGGYFYAVYDDIEAALPWFERVADLGFAKAGIENITFPGLEEISKDPRMISIQKRYAENAARYSSLIKVQLDNPKPSWVENQ